MMNAKNRFVKINGSLTERFFYIEESPLFSSKFAHGNLHGNAGLI